MSDQPPNTIGWDEAWHIREVYERLENIVSSKTADSLDSKGCNRAGSLKDYVSQMLDALDDLVVDLEDVRQFIATEIPQTEGYYVTDEWEEKPEK